MLNRWYGMMVTTKLFTLCLMVFFFVDPLWSIEEKKVDKAELSFESQSNDQKGRKNNEANASDKCSSLCPELKDENLEPPKIGNFSLPTSQQPAALFGFGGNIIDKGEVQFYLFADYFVGRQRRVSDLIPSILFGITDDLSIFFNAPMVPYLKDRRNRSSGLEDFFLQLEYAFYTKKTPFYINQATVVTNIAVPTGSVNKTPNTGFGAPSFFIGGTFYHETIDWFAFTSHGALLTLSENRTKIGDQFLYQFGFGRNIPSFCGWIWAWMFEIDGQYSRKNRIKGRLDPNSGGNVLYATPSIWVSTKEMLLQFGVSASLNQNLFGHQRRIDYAFNLNFAWSFY